MVPTISGNGAPFGFQVNEIPTSLPPLRAAAAVEDDGEIALLQIGHGLPVRMPVQIKPNAGMAFQKRLQSIASF